MRCFCTKTKTYHCKVVLLDDQELLQEILVSAYIVNRVFLFLFSRWVPQPKFFAVLARETRQAERIFSGREKPSYLYILTLFLSASNELVPGFH